MDTMSAVPGHSSRFCFVQQPGLSFHSLQALAGLWDGRVLRHGPDWTVQERVGGAAGRDS